MIEGVKRGIVLLFSFFLVLVIVLFWFFSVQAAIPKKLTIQGRLDQGGSLADGNYAMVFKIYDQETGGTALWSESHTGSNKVAVSNGFFKVVLGDLTAINLDFNVPYWLGITIEADSEISPRIELTSSSYAMKARGLILDENLNIDSGTLFVDISNNKVGVGTTTPTQALEVAGTIYSTSGGFKFPDATTMTTAATGDIEGVIAGTNLSGGGTSGSVTLNVVDSPTFSGNLTVSGGTINNPNSSYRWVGGSNWNYFYTPSGYIQLGPANTSYAHIYTDRPAFYFNKTNLYANGSKIWHAGNDGSGSGLDADLVDGSHRSSFFPLKNCECKYAQCTGASCTATATCTGGKYVVAHYGSAFYEKTCEDVAGASIGLAYKNNCLGGTSCSVTESPQYLYNVASSVIVCCGY